ncbi:hypothetical protein P5673_022099 [Acropora cervicornis]|uniref:Uncharacterized protein n=1 Tax=Acropora cervicornis TaxID=6130 RepID=A0AAD9UZX8_ACRCE|nr:hypothetical protein P5673_022099 [Acropora cervicornis]
MTSTSLLLFSAVLCIAVYSCLGKNPTPTSKTQCEYESIRKCNRDFKKVFKDARNVTGKYSSRVHAYDVYCDAIQTFMDCLESALSNCSNGAWLSEYSFVVLEHGIMDKKCGVCPEHSYDSLIGALQARKKEGYVGSDDCPPCAQRVHETCVWHFLRKMKNQSNMCEDIQEFITCYKKASKKKSCAYSEIIKKFSKLCQIQGERMLEEDRKHPGMMC